MIEAGRTVQATPCGVAGAALRPCYSWPPGPGDRGGGRWTMMYRFAVFALVLPQVVPPQAALAQESAERIIQVTGTASV